MRRIAIVIAGTVSVIVLLFSYHTSRNQEVRVAASPPTVSTAPAPSADPGTGSGTGTGTGAGTGTGTGTRTRTSKTFTGDAADTPYGPVQVEITMSGGRITVARTVQVPQESGRDVEINSAAVPVLNSEAVQAQTAQIDTVSGATYTSEGYVQSLQSAIDAAHR